MHREFMINTAPWGSNSVNGRERYINTVNFQNHLGSGRMAQWLVAALFCRRKLECRFKSRRGIFQFFFSFIVFLPFGFLLFILTADPVSFARFLRKRISSYSGLPFEMHWKQVRPESLQTFQRSYASSKVKNENDAIPKLTSDVFLNQKPNKQSKQTSHE